MSDVSRRKHGFPPLFHRDHHHHRSLPNSVLAASAKQKEVINRLLAKISSCLET
jgi:hypothetical protein